MATYEPTFGYYEACAFLAMPKKPKQRKPRKPSIKIGSNVIVCGPNLKATVIAKHANRGWWTFEAENGWTSSCDRSVLKLID
jgi:hypothetical protein